MTELIDLAEKFRIAAAEAIFGSETAIENADRRVSPRLVGELEVILDAVRMEEAAKAADRLAVCFGGKPCPFDFTLRFKLADVLARMGEECLDPGTRKSLIGSSEPSQDISDAFSAKGYPGLARAFAPPQAARISGPDKRV